MSKNVIAFIQGPVSRWLRAAAITEEVPTPIGTSGFFIVPVSQSDPSYETLSRELVARFSTSRVLKTLRVEEFVFRSVVLRDGDMSILACRMDGQPWTSSESPPYDFEPEEVTFLHQMELVTDEEIQPQRRIPARLFAGATSATSPIFEEDLRTYLPYVVSWALPRSSTFYSDALEINIARLLINIAPAHSPARTFAEKIVELALVMPPVGHAWLFDQLYFAVSSRHQVHFFLALYKMLEFFFPLKGVAALKNAIRFEGSILQLREFCNNALGWNINHNSGVRAAATLCGDSFARVCLGRPVEADATPDTVEKYKAEAVSKIAELRHALAHQNFSALSPADADVSRKTHALLLLLIDAFEAYKKHH